MNAIALAVWRLAFQADSDDRLPAGRDKQDAYPPTVKNNWQRESTATPARSAAARRYVFSAKGAGSCKPAAAGKSFPQKRALNLLGSKADSVEPKAKKPGSLSDH